MANIYDTVIDRRSSEASKYKATLKLFGTDELLPMWVADMDIASPLCAQEALLQRAGHRLYGYERMSDAAFAVQCDWVRKRHNTVLNQELMLYSFSIVASINVAIMAFTDPGDGVIVQKPVYAPFFHSVTEQGRNVVEAPLVKDAKGHYTMDLERLENSITETTKLMILCSPHNPVGRVWERDELEAVVRLCRAHNIILFSDEAHCDLVYAPAKHTSLFNIEAAWEIGIMASGPGKTFNLSGLSISTVAFANEALCKRFDAVRERIHFSQPSVLSTVAFEAAYSQGEAWLEGLLVYLTKNEAMLHEVLDAFPGVIRAQKNEGTYLAWLNCSQMGLNNKALKEFFVTKAKLGLSQGIFFGKEGSSHMRLNYAVPRQVMAQACEQLYGALKHL